MSKLEVCLVQYLFLIADRILGMYMCVPFFRSWIYTQSTSGVLVFFHVILQNLEVCKTKRMIR